MYEGVLANIISKQTFDFYQIFLDKKFYLTVMEGIKWTLLLTITAAVIGLIIGVIIAVIQIAQFPKKFAFLGKFLKFICKIYIDIIRGTPAILQLSFFWFVVFANSDTPKLIVAGISFGVNSGAYMAELIRAGIQGIDKGQMEAGRSLGLKYMQTMRYIILPQAFKQMLPAFVSEVIVLIKETAVIGMVGGMDLMRSFSIMQSRTYNAIQPLLIVGICYLILTGVFTKVMRKVEAKVNVGK
mgnify:CR=1 FL=1